MKHRKIKRGNERITTDQLDEIFEKKVLFYTLISSGVVVFFFAAILFYLNYFEQFFGEQELPPVAETIDMKAELLKKLTFASDYELIEDLEVVEKKDDLAIGYVIGEDVLAVANTIPDEKSHVRKGFVKWATLVQKAEGSFTKSNAGKVVQYWNNDGYLLETHHEYRNLYAELAMRSRLMLESLNDMQHNPNAANFYATIYKNLLSYERTAELYHLQVIEDSLYAKGKTTTDYDVTDMWLAQVKTYEYAHGDWRKEVFLK